MKQIVEERGQVESDIKQLEDELENNPNDAFAQKKMKRKRN